MNKKKVLLGCAAVVAGYMTACHILQKMEEKQYKKQFDEIINNWKKEKKADTTYLKRNVLVIGEDKEEKENIVIHDLLKGDKSAVVNDPTGYIYEETAISLRKKGYITYFIDLSKANILDGLPMELSDLGRLSKEKIVLYISGIVSSKDNVPEACYLSLFYNQIFSTLKKEDSVYPVRFYLGEFGEQPMLPEFYTYLTKMADYHASVLFFIKDIPQIKSVYFDDCDAILTACDSILFLGGTEPNTLHYLYEHFASDEVYYLSKQNCILFSKNDRPCVFLKKQLFSKKEG